MKRLLRKTPDSGMRLRLRPHSGKYTVLLCLIVLAVTGVLNAGNSGGRSKILVLGFGSAFLNDVQDMILREQVMRDFKSKGYAVFPIMKIEDHFRENGLNISNISRDLLKNLCSGFDSDFALAGGVEVRRRKLFVALSLYRRDADQYYNFIIPMGKKAEFQNYCASLSREIVRRADIIIKSGEK